MTIVVTFVKQKEETEMHPRERILGLAENLMSKGKELPKDLIHEAKLFGITLTQENNVKTKGVNKDGPKES
jgi:hypothetical protein